MQIWVIYACDKFSDQRDELFIFVDEADAKEAMDKIHSISGDNQIALIRMDKMECPEHLQDFASDLLYEKQLESANV